MFDFIDDAIGDLVSGYEPFEPVTDWLSGYTSANAANRFTVQNMAEQQMYNERNMQIQQDYNERNMGLTDDYQRQLMLDSPSLQVAALRRANLNPLLAIDKGINSASTAVHSQSPSSSTPSPITPTVSPQISVGDAISGLGMLSGLAKLSPEVDLLRSQSAAAKAQAAASSANAFKATQQALSIDPELEKDVKRTSKSELGRTSHDILSMIRDFLPSAWFGSNSASDKPTATISTESAKGIEDSVKRLNKRTDEIHLFPREDKSLRFNPRLYR